MSLVVSAQNGITSPPLLRSGFSTPRKAHLFLITPARQAPSSYSSHPGSCFFSELLLHQPKRSSRQAIGNRHLASSFSCSLPAPKPHRERSPRGPATMQDSTQTAGALLGLPPAVFISRGSSSFSGGGGSPMPPAGSSSAPRMGVALEKLRNAAHSVPAEEQGPEMVQLLQGLECVLAAKSQLRQAATNEPPLSQTEWPDTGSHPLLFKVGVGQARLPRKWEHGAPASARLGGALEGAWDVLPGAQQDSQRYVLVPLQGLVSFLRCQALAISGGHFSGMEPGLQDVLLTCSLQVRSLHGACWQVACWLPATNGTMSRGWWVCLRVSS
ncbi:hypothetical protein ABPG75_008964 [Micractinium tetrahymenae]